MRIKKKLEENREVIDEFFKKTVGIDLDHCESATGESTFILRFAESKAEAEKINKEKKDNAIRGKKVKTGAETAGAARAAQIKEERALIWADWQKRAEEIWSKNPNHTKSAVALIIARETMNPISTIRQRIFKPPEKS